VKRREQNFTGTSEKKGEGGGVILGRKSRKIHPNMLIEGEGGSGRGAQPKKGGGGTYQRKRGGEKRVCKKKLASCKDHRKSGSK